MNADRAHAYQRIIATVDDLSAGKLHPDEQRIVREAADAMLFAGDGPETDELRDAIAALTALTDRLLDADRLTPEALDRILTDVAACGPPSMQLAA